MMTGKCGTCDGRVEFREPDHEWHRDPFPYRHTDGERDHHVTVVRLDPPAPRLD